MNLIVAAAEDWGIGKDGDLLFHISPDLKHFKALTLYGTVVMGRRTLESLPGGRPLKNRINLVLSRSLAEEREKHSREGILICRDLEELKDRLAALEQEPADGDVWVLGGADVYGQLLPCCRYAYVTRVQASRPADVYLPDLTREPGWQLKDAGTVQEWEGLFYRFDVFENLQIQPL